MKVLSLFDGMSCGRIALRELGIEPEKYYASEIDKYAIAQTKLNFPDTIHLGDVTKWKDWDIDWKNIDLILAGSPCFAAGTKVITFEGIKCIEDIKEGDMVLTHRNRFRKVLRVGAKISPTIILSAQGIIDTEVTDNHPYYVREMKRVWDNSRRTYVRTFSEPIWKSVKDMRKDDFIGMPINLKSENPLSITPEEAHILGRYIADGHTRKDYKVSEGRPNDRHWQLILSIGKSKVPSFSSELPYSMFKHSKSTYRAVFSSKRLVQIAEKYCGIGAVNKRISIELLNLPVNILRKLIEGYIEGDGCYHNKTYRMTTVSKDLAISLSLAIAKVYGKHSNIEYRVRPSTTIIEGRKVNQRNTYTVYFQKERNKQDHSVIIDNIVWMRFKRFYPSGRITTVYNMEVEEDNSYTANNAIVHNCQGFSFAGKKLAFDDPRSALFFVFADILNHVKGLNPDVLFLLENVNMKKRHMKVITDYVGVYPVNINSMLVSAQSRNRWYWTNIRTRREGLFGELHSDIPQPKDRGIFLKDILEENVDRKYFLSKKMSRFLESHAEKMNTKMKVLGENDKSRCITATAEYKGNLETNYVCVGIRGREACLTTKRTEYGKQIRKQYEAGKIHEKRKRIQRLEPRTDGKTNCLTTTVKDNYIVHFGDDPSMEMTRHEEANLRGLDEKAHSLTASSYKDNESNGMTLVEDPNMNKDVISGSIVGYDGGQHFREIKSGKSCTLTARARNDGSGQPCVRNSGSIRRLTPTECARLQTIPEWYKWGCSETQQYRMLGNGWTVEVIKHILSFANFK